MIFVAHLIPKLKTHPLKILFFFSREILCPFVLLLMPSRDRLILHPTKAKPKIEAMIGAIQTNRCSYLGFKRAPFSITSNKIVDDLIIAVALLYQFCILIFMATAASSESPQHSILDRQDTSILDKS